jgi:hypothetical protein
MNYPYYIVQWTEGRIPCPAHQRMIPAIRRQFESGRIGGRRNVERETDNPEEAKALWNRDRINRRVYVVTQRGCQRRLIRNPDRLKEESGNEYRT